MEKAYKIHPKFWKVVIKSKADSMFEEVHNRVEDIGKFLEDNRYDEAEFLVEPLSMEEFKETEPI